MSHYYESLLYHRINDLLQSGKEIDELNNYELAKVFEYYTCIRLSQEHSIPFLCYEDIDPTFKEERCMSYQDTGIDVCNLKDTIVQCKLRKERLSLGECATFLASQNRYNPTTEKTEVLWQKMILCRNDEIKLSRELQNKIHSRLLTDIPFSRNQLLEYCKDLIGNMPKIEQPKESTTVELRDYQKECIQMIHDNGNCIICIPTGTGKNVVIIHSIENGKKYLILVPRIILMDQLKDELIRYRPELKNSIHLIGDGNNTYDSKKDIHICVFNSVSVVEPHASQYHKIYVDEAHHIREPRLYTITDDEEYEDNIEVSYSESDEDYDEVVEDEDTSNDDMKENAIADSEDELKCSSYMTQIAEFKKYNNNVYLSATIDNIEGFAYKKEDIRAMIESGYLCDYTLNIPIFNSDPTSRNICEYLVKTYRNTIIYCHSQKEGTKINAIMNELMPNCSKYIDCHTPRNERMKIISEYKTGKIPFLVNVRVLTEGFDAPITSSVCFLHLPSNQTQVIQIIGRCLRLHPLKKYASIILPSSSDENCKTISYFMKIVSNNDSRIRSSYYSKTLGGYISITSQEDETDESSSEFIEYQYELVYNSVGLLVNGHEIWRRKLELVKKFIDGNHRRPIQRYTNQYEKKLGRWLSQQIVNSNSNSRKKIMKDDEIFAEWNEFIADEKYNEYFRSNKEVWICKLEMLKKFIDENQRRPSSISTNTDEKKLGKWLSQQINNSKHDTRQSLKMDYMDYHKI